MATLPAASEVNDLVSLWQVFREAPRKVGEAWYIVALADLSVRDNSAEINRKHTWACVQIGAFIINEKICSFTRQLGCSHHSGLLEHRHSASVNEKSERVIIGKNNRVGDGSKAGN